MNGTVSHGIACRRRGCQNDTCELLNLFIPDRQNVKKDKHKENEKEKMKEIEKKGCMRFWDKSNNIKKL